MIIWLTGRQGAGKSTLAKKLKGNSGIILDEDDMYSLWPDLDTTPMYVEEFNRRIAYLAEYLSSQGYDVIVAAVAPYEKLRKEIKKITDCIFMYLEHREPVADIEAPYEEAWEADTIVVRREDEVVQERKLHGAL